MAAKLKTIERIEVEHWRRWIAQGGVTLVFAPMAIKPLLEIIDRLAPPKRRKPALPPQQFQPATKDHT